MKLSRSNLRKIIIEELSRSSKRKTRQSSKRKTAHSKKTSRANIRTVLNEEAWKILISEADMSDSRFARIQARISRDYSSAQRLGQRYDAVDAIDSVRASDADKELLKTWLADQIESQLSTMTDDVPDIDARGMDDETLAATIAQVEEEEGIEFEMPAARVAEPVETGPEYDNAEWVKDNMIEVFGDIYENGVGFLKRGDKGDQVIALQTLLLDAGEDLGSHGADGDFGGATYNAVRSFQQKKRDERAQRPVRGGGAASETEIGVDGKAGRQTLVLLQGIGIVAQSGENLGTNLGGNVQADPINLDGPQRARAQGYVDRIKAEMGQDVPIMQVHAWLTLDQDPMDMAVDAV